jgi:hypothetical protein
VTAGERTREDRADQTAAPAVTWFVRTAGAPRDCGYSWLSITEGADAELAERLICEPLAGCDPGQLTDGEHPSLLLARTKDGGWALYVGGLSPKRVPKGDNRRIHTVVMGLAAPGADLAPLIAVAGRALLGELADMLPLDWPGGRPRIVPDEPWPPAAPDHDGRDAADLDESVGYPAAAPHRRAVWDDLAALSAEDLARFAQDRPLVLQTTFMAPDRLEALRPWRATAARLGAKRTHGPRPRDAKESKTGDKPGGTTPTPHRGSRGRASSAADSGVPGSPRVVRGSGKAGREGEGGVSRVAAFWLGAGFGLVVGVVVAFILEQFGVWRWR